MKLQSYIAETTQTAADEAFRYAKGVPADKLDWKPEGTGRSVLDLCRELAMCPDWAVSIISTKEQSGFDENDWAEAQKIMAGWTTVDECQAVCNEKLSAYKKFLEDMPDERLSETKWLPYGGGRDYTMPEMMDYPKWNFTYHLGQIAYIQTLYGDKDMY